MGGVAVPSYFDHYVRNHGFKRRNNAPFEAEFARLARCMNWENGSHAFRKQRSAAMVFDSDSKICDDGTMPRLNTLASQQGLISCIPGFRLRPELPFNVEFDRLVAHINPKSKERFRRRHYAAALDLDTQLLAMRVSDVTFFRQFEGVHLLGLSDELPIDAAFKILANHMDWKNQSPDFLIPWSRLVREAVSRSTGTGISLANLAFFKKYLRNSRFRLQGGLSADEEFKRLAQEMNWVPNGPAYDRHYALMHTELETKKVAAHTPRLHASGVSPIAKDDIISTRSNAQSKSHLTPAALQDDAASTTTTALPCSVRIPAPPSFFSRYSNRGFEENPHVGIEKEFDRLSLHMQWPTKGTEHIKHWRAAIVGDISSQYGKSTTLDGWKSLCEELGIEPVPNTITQCKKALQQKHVNIVDLVNARRIVPDAVKKPVRQFESAAELARYCRQSGKLFPKVGAKEEGFLKVLLTNVYAPEKAKHKKAGGAKLSGIPKG